MANAKEIQDRIKSIKDTRKITNAMYMISSSKLKKAKKSLEDTEPYFYTLQSTLSRILRHIPDVEHKYFDERKEIPENEKKRGYIVVTADKGMAGAYNHNVIKMAEEQLGKGKNNMLFVLGQIGYHYFEKKNVQIDMKFQYTIQNPTQNRARNIAEFILDLYETKQLDEVYIIFTKMVSSVAAETEMSQLLPLKKSDYHAGDIPIDVPLEEIAFVPSPEAVCDMVVPNIISGYVYGALVEAYASEQNARMMAMESATKSANDMLRELGIIFNRVRQAAITQEITEVIGGAKAQKKKVKH